MNIKHKLFSALAVGSLLVGFITPAALAQNATVNISGNGAFSNNTANVTSNTTTTVVQNNTATITNNVSSNVSTGNNTASFNTGGNTSVNTGSAGSAVSIQNKANLNHASIDTCGGCNGGSTDVNISGNGAFSNNTANVTKDTTISLFQENDANFRNNVTTNVSSGNNSASFNTGGDTTIRTGDALSDVAIRNAANANIASIGGNGNGTGGNTSASIIGNGAFSTNTIDLDMATLTTLVQDNDARFTNNVTNNVSSGNNTADFNTGGDTTINTADALSRVRIWNAANFNAADIDCGCLTDVNAKISGNGAFSNSDIFDNFNKTLSAFQENDANFNNRVRDDSSSGFNSASYNTGPVTGDATSIDTGFAGSDIGVRNVSNVNHYGSGETMMPLPGGMSIEFSFDLHEILGLL